MKAKDIMRRRIITIGAERTLREAARVLIDKRISGAPVIDGGGRLVGVLSQTDLVRHERETSPRFVDYYKEGEVATLPKGFQVEAPDYTRVRDAMTPVVLSADESATLPSLARMMVRKHIHRIVITRRGRPAGIVTSLDLVRQMGRSDRLRRRR